MFFWHYFLSYSFLFFLLLELMGDAMGGIKLQNGGDEQEQHPLVVEIGDVGLVVGEPVARKGVHGVDHRNTREHEEDVGDALYALEPMHDRRGTLVELHGLHHAEEHRARQESPAGIEHQTLPHKTKRKAARADYHQHATKQEQHTLKFTQLSHFYPFARYHH